ncbi:MAG TPA: hypothetical protein VFS60_17410 [Thermoanaerobaculia bacterium]|nr:hypothetical protein [Thermoanaerobaculia bacterium]
MAENFALYSTKWPELPEAQMLELAGQVRPEVYLAPRGRTFFYSWPDLMIRCSEMPKGDLASHLAGFEGYVTKISRGRSENQGRALIERIRKTRLVVGVEVEPGRDREGRAEDLIGKLCYGLEPIMFFENALYDWDGRLLLGPDGSFDAL